MLTLIVAIIAIVFFSFRAHEQEVRANQLEAELAAYKANEQRLICELKELRKSQCTCDAV